MNQSQACNYELKPRNSFMRKIKYITNNQNDEKIMEMNNWRPNINGNKKLCTGTIVRQII